MNRPDLDPLLVKIGERLVATASAIRIVEGLMEDTEKLLKELRKRVEDGNQS